MEEETWTTLSGDYNAAAGSDAPKDGPAPNPLADLPPRVRDFLDQHAVAEPLKDLCQNLIPGRNFARFADRLARGDFDEHLACSAHPMGGLLAQLCAAPKELGTDWLKAVANHDAFDLAALTVPYYAANNRYFSSIKDYSGSGTVFSASLGSWLVSQREMKIIAVAQFAPRLLAQNHRTNDITQPLIHHALFHNSVSISTLRNYVEATGSLDFITFENNAGQNMFHRLASAKGYYHQMNIVEAVSWLIERKPELVHSTDEAGWTVLDRYVANMTQQSIPAPAGIAESPMLRLLLSADAPLRRQTPPGLSLVDYHAAQKSERKLIDKPTGITRKPSS